MADVGLLDPGADPFFGGTYLPKAQFLAILEAIQNQWKESPDKIQEVGRQMAEWMKEATRPSGTRIDLNSELFSRFFQHMNTTFDWQFGGVWGLRSFLPQLNSACF